LARGIPRCATHAEALIARRNFRSDFLCFLRQSKFARARHVLPDYGRLKALRLHLYSNDRPRTLVSRMSAKVIFRGRSAIANDPADLTDREADTPWGHGYRSHMMGSGQRSVTRWSGPSSSLCPRRTVRRWDRSLVRFDSAGRARRKAGSEACGCGHSPSRSANR
jgi:hypothetical protein